MSDNPPVWARKTITDLFAEQVTTRGEDEAVRSRRRRLSYAELDRESNRLGQALLDRGIGAGDVVGVLLEREVDTAVTLLAVLKTGAAYLAVQPDEPAGRRNVMLRQAAASVVVTQPHLAAGLEGGPATALLVGEGTGDGAPLPPPATGPESLAYISFTSGSTGEPKGVSVPHRGVVRLVQDGVFADLGPDQVFLHLAPLAFDASTLEIWAPLLNGGRLVVHQPGPVAVPELSQTVAEQEVTTMWLTAGLFHQFVDGDLAGLSRLRQLIAGGDVLSVPHVNRVLAEYPDLRLVNGYGPTENTTFTACHVLTGPIEGAVPIGRPIAGTRVYVLDEAGERVPDGEWGELYAGGAGVALGYVGRPDLTAERFLPDLEQPDTRMYRTGDLVRVNPDGDLEFRGRADTQVKLRGYRIELGEIETVLASQPEVVQAVVVARKDPVGGRSTLHAYVVPAVPGADLGPQVRRAAQAVLPEYMVPATVTSLAELPLTANGKVDRAALPAPTVPDRPTSEEYVAPRTDLERVLTDIWQGRDRARADRGERRFLRDRRQLAARRRPDRPAVPGAVVQDRCPHDVRERLGGRTGRRPGGCASRGGDLMRITRPDPGTRVDLAGIDLYDPATFTDGDAHLIWQTLRAEAPVSRQVLADGRAFWSVAKYDDVSFVLADHTAFTAERGAILKMLGTDDPAGGHQMAITDPPRHTELREPQQRLLTHAALAPRMDEIRAAIRRLLAPMYDGGEWDLGALMVVLPMLISGMLMGLPEKDHEDLVRWGLMTVAPDHAEIQVDGDPELTVLTAHRELFGYFADLIADRRRSGAEPDQRDLIGRLMTLEAEGRPLREGEIISNAYSTLLGANVNTGHVVSAAVLELFDHPEQWRAWADDPTLFRSGLREALRWSSPVLHFLRYATHDVELGGRQLRAGDGVVAWIPSANRDEDYFEDPYRFDVARRPNRHLTFGTGPHACIGAAAAFITLQFTFEEIFEHVEVFEPAGEPVHLCSNFTAGLTHLPVNTVLRARRRAPGRRSA